MLNKYPQILLDAYLQQIALDIQNLMLFAVIFEIVFLFRVL